MEILKEKPVGINEIKDSIAFIKKREKELNFRAKKVEEYVNTNSKIKKTSVFLYKSGIAAYSAKQKKASANKINGKYL